MAFRTTFVIYLDVYVSSTVSLLVVAYHAYGPHMLLITVIYFAGCTSGIVSLIIAYVVVVVVLLFNVHGKHLRSCRDGYHSL